MKLEGLTPGKTSKRDLARKHYSHWQWRTTESKVFKALLFALARGKCPSCGVDMVMSFNEKINTQDNAATLDHTIPLAYTLEHSKYGLEIMCKKCNSAKSDKLPQEVKK